MTERIAIVGNGVVGLSLALRLSQGPRPPQVTVFGPESIAHAYAGSNAAPAMINVFGEVTPKLDRFWSAQHQLDIGESAMALWPRLVAELNEALTAAGEPALSLHRGTYIVARGGQESDQRNLQAVRRALGARNREWRELNLQTDSDHPIVQPARFSEAIYVPDEMFIDGTRLYHALLVALRQRPNVSLVERWIAGIETDPPVLRDEHGRQHRCDAVVLANSYGFNDLVEQLGLAGQVPYLLPVYGVGMLVAGSTDRPSVVRTPVYGSSCGDYLLHFPNHIYVGASAITHSGRVEITSHLQRSLDFFNPDVNLNNICLTGGIRAMSQDMHPVIGELGRGVWAAAGFFKSGVTLAPYVADLLGRELLGEQQPYENRFGPYRRVDEQPPSNDELAATVFDEIKDSQSSSGSREQLRRFGWMVRLLLRLEVHRIVRGFHDGVYYNSDIVQACVYDRDRQAKLNRYRPAA